MSDKELRIETAKIKAAEIAPLAEYYGFTCTVEYGATVYLRHKAERSIHADAEVSWVYADQLNEWSYTGKSGRGIRCANTERVLKTLKKRADEYIAEQRKWDKEIEEGCSASEMITAQYGIPTESHYGSVISSIRFSEDDTETIMIYWNLDGTVNGVKINKLPKDKTEIFVEFIKKLI